MEPHTYESTREYAQKQRDEGREVYNKAIRPSIEDQLQIINSRLETIERKAFKEIFADNLPDYNIPDWKEIAVQQQTQLDHLRDAIDRIRYHTEEIAKCLLSGNPK